MAANCLTLLIGFSAFSQTPPKFVEGIIGGSGVTLVTTNFTTNASGAHKDVTVHVLTFANVLTNYSLRSTNGGAIFSDGTAAFPQFVWSNNIVLLGQSNTAVVSNGNGSWTISSAGGGTPGGDNLAIQYKNDTNFGGFDTNYIFIHRDTGLSTLRVGQTVIGNSQGGGDFASIWNGAVADPVTGYILGGDGSANTYFNGAAIYFRIVNVDVVSINSTGFVGDGSQLTGYTLASALGASGITPVADGTYTVGLGITQDGIITVASGVITAITEAQ